MIHHASSKPNLWKTTGITGSYVYGIQTGMETIVK